MIAVRPIACIPGHLVPTSEEFEGVKTALERAGYVVLKVRGGDRVYVAGSGDIADARAEEREQAAKLSEEAGYDCHGLCAAAIRAGKAPAP